MRKPYDHEKFGVGENEILPFAEIWKGLETVTQSETSKKEKQISYNSAYMWNLEKWYR